MNEHWGYRISFTVGCAVNLKLFLQLVTALEVDFPSFVSCEESEHSCEIHKVTELGN